ncbi:MAG: sugar transferase [Bacteroidetes bacterium]|nr:sugar transferase [Bacteroidota bacterium]
MKRLIDFLSSLFLIVLTLPLIILVSFLIKITDKGPIFYLQRRVGLHGKIFMIYKFRSMYHAQGKDWPYSTSTNDPRITRIGYYLRKSSMDEIPQLLNVLKGEMSLIGPRPNVEAQISNYTPEEYSLRNSVLPGITGLAQATIRSYGTEKERLEKDLFYVNNMCFLLDLKIIFLTIKQVLLKGGN